MPLTSYQKNKLSRGKPIQIRGGAISSKHQVHNVHVDPKTFKGIQRAFKSGKGKRIFGLMEGGYLRAPTSMLVKKPALNGGALDTGVELSMGTDQQSGNFLTRVNSGPPRMHKVPNLTGGAVHFPMVRKIGGNGFGPIGGNGFGAIGGNGFGAIGSNKY